MREDHDTTCAKCALILGPCDDPTCICRYNHNEGLCEACEEVEAGKEWREE
jgi:hypothetical protein